MRETRLGDVTNDEALGMRAQAQVRVLEPVAEGRIEAAALREPGRAHRACRAGNDDRVARAAHALEIRRKVSVREKPVGVREEHASRTLRDAVFVEERRTGDRNVVARKRRDERHEWIAERVRVVIEKEYDRRLRDARAGIRGIAEVRSGVEPQHAYPIEFLEPLRRLVA